MSENYIPLYRKYRPQTLETLVGQEHIKKTLTSAIELNKISHAYLFTGPRGTGKTSTARILAKSLNCKNGPTVHPCGECESCKDIANSIPIDVIEIDAASNRKVEDAQNILDKVQYVPVNGRYKIYIIDEVHMLTNHAFNALLKTLEEPPENVIFILATTEVHKVLDTIKSRCQRFDFRRITTDDIVKHLRYISDKEGINISDDALFAIAKNSAGGMRDSISLLDQLSLLGVSKQITTDDVNAILGRISFDVLHKLASKIIASSPSESIELLNEIYNSGNEPLQILMNLNEYFKNLLIVKTCSDNLLGELTGLNESQLKDLSGQKNLLETQQIVFLIERIFYYIKEVKQATNQHLWLEVGMIDIANMTENTTLINLQTRVAALESNGGQVVAKQVIKPAVTTRPAPIPPVKQPEKNEIVHKQQVEDKSNDDFTPPPMSKI
jgi:DNA polymerase-3 subunit gamma/tau